MYEYDPETLQALQREPMELTSCMEPGFQLNKYLGCKIEKKISSSSELLSNNSLFGGQL